MYVNNPTCDLKILINKEFEHDTKFLKKVETLVKDLKASIIIGENPSAQLSAFDKHQFFMLTAYKYVDREYTAFLDTDTFFHTKVHTFDLFVDGKPKIYGFIKKVWDRNGFWIKMAESTLKLLGRPEPFHTMCYFPVIMKTDHLIGLKDYIMKQTNFTTYDSALHSVAKYIYPTKAGFAQFHLMGSYAWYYLKDKYYFDLVRFESTQELKARNSKYFKVLMSSGFKEEAAEKYTPRVAAHYKYESKDYQKNFRAISLCYSLKSSDKIPDICAKYRSQNPYKLWWTFENVEFHSLPNAVKAQKDRLENVRKCENEYSWDRSLFPPNFR
jgi:hypothetical protein